MWDANEGEVFKVITAYGKTFRILYGYSDDTEREHGEPQPIFPDFIKNPEYTSDGEPFVMAYQNICDFYKAKPEVSGESWCNDCTYFENCEEGLGICRCNERKYHKNN